MRTNIFSSAVSLSDGDLLARLDALARTEREATAELVAHLAVLEIRPSLYAAQGYGSLFDYCTRALRLSEDAACNRIQVTRACRRFPVILDMLAIGSVSLRSLRVLGPHLTAENHAEVLARAANRRRGDIDALAAELAPQPDVVASVRKVPVRKGTVPSEVPPTLSPLFTSRVSTEETAAFTLGPQTDVAGSADQRGSAAALLAPVSPGTTAPHAHAPRPTVRPSAPNRYRVQFTIGQESHDKLRRLQAFLRREIPSGDPGTIFELMLAVYLEKIEKAKLGGTMRSRRGTSATRPARPSASLPADPPAVDPTAGRPDHSYELRIRPGADRPSRHIPNAVKRLVWYRDGGQCAFVSAEGRHCSERAFLELHHIQPYALDGPATAANISLRCRRHNQYEAEVVFGPCPGVVVTSD